MAPLGASMQTLVSSRALLPSQLCWEAGSGGLDVLTRRSGQRQDQLQSQAAVTISHRLSTSESASPLEKYPQAGSPPGTLKWMTQIVSTAIQAEVPSLLEFLWVALGWLIMQIIASTSSCSVYEERHSQIRQTSLCVSSCLCSSDPYRSGNGSESSSSWWEVVVVEGEDVCTTESQAWAGKIFLLPNTPRVWTNSRDVMLHISLLIFFKRQRSPLRTHENLLKSSRGPVRDSQL